MNATNLKLVGASATKPPLGIVPMHPLVGVSRVLEDSAMKYAPYNYMVQPVLDAIEAYDSAELRHRLASTLLGGQVTPESYAALDPDSGIPHIFHRIAGLLILASLLIRDGVISEDPGMGKRKRAAFAEPEPDDEPTGEFTPVAPWGACVECDAPATGNAGMDGLCDAHGNAHNARREFAELTLDDEDKPTPRLIALAERIAQRAYDAHNPPAVVIESRFPGGDWYVCQEHQSDTCLHPDRDEKAPSAAELPDRDPDAERRTATERNLEQLKRDQEKLAAEKLRWEWRCLTCNGAGIVPGAGEYTTEQCATCNGTGLRTGAEGVRQ